MCLDAEKIGERAGIAQRDAAAAAAAKSLKSDASLKSPKKDRLGPRSPRKSVKLNLRKKANKNKNQILKQHGSGIILNSSLGSP